MPARRGIPSGCQEFFTHPGGPVAFEEKRAWMMAVVAVVGYATYAAVVLGRADGRPLADVPYAGALLWTIAGAIAASIVAHTVISTVSPEGANQSDQRDREIHRT